MKFETVPDAASPLPTLFKKIRNYNIFHTFKYLAFFRNPLLKEVFVLPRMGK